MDRMTIIVPCYNEQETLEDYYQAISRVREQLLDLDCRLEILLVDDGSSDETLARMK